ncbi:MAG: hypothetical protein NTW22_01650, partial [Proteobacteria bacterium]|nr:hypothetical protein [Pseudomonadota bacterium]
MFFALLMGSCAHATITLHANGATSSTTFTGNNVSAHVADSNDINSCFYVGRNDPTIPAGLNDGLAEYAVSAAREGLGTVFPYAPTTVRLNGVEGQTNPLAGQQIALLGLFSGAYGTRTPFAVTHDSPQNLYWNVSGPGMYPFDVFSITNIADANGAVTLGVVAATGASIFESTSTTQIRGNFIFAAVKPNVGVFGVPGSGIAMIGQAVNALGQAAAVVGDGSVKAVPLDGAQSYVQIVAPADIQPTTPDVYFDPITQRVYSAFTVITRVAATDGARGIVTGYFNPITVGNDLLNKFVLTNFAPAAAYAGLGRNAVGGLVSVGAAVTGTYLKFCSMYTTTGLTYGIIVGSNGATVANQTVSAVPLVNKSVDPANITWPTDPTQGAMASKIVNSGTNLKTFFSSQYPLYYPYMGRGFQIPATTPADMPLFAEDAVKVGGGVTPGVIRDIQVNKDTIFVAVDAGIADAAGVFASQALFDGNAAIKGWTPWQRVATPTQAGTTIYGIGYQPQVGKLFTMEGGTANTIDTVLSTTWNTADNDGLLGGTTTDAQVGFVELIDTQFSEGQGGIQVAFDFPNNTLGFSTVATRLSVMIFTGYKQVVIAQTGSDVAGLFTPTVGNFSANMQISTNGAVTPPGAGALILSITGGDLDKIGAIISAAVVRDIAVGPGNGYFVVGGVGGLAVLKPGWPMGGIGLQANFANLPASAFTHMGSYKNVRKIWSDDANFYVLTNDTFDRVPATQLAGTTLTPVTLATPTMLSQKYGQFSDVLVSAKVALLATSQGLFRTGNGADVSTATTPAAMGWTAVTLPESQLAVTRLQPLSITGLPEGFSKNPVGGTVYALAGSVNYDLASLYRIAVASTEAAAVTATTVQVIPDYFVQSTTSAFAALGAYRNYTPTFGALVTASESSPDGVSPIFEALPPFLRTGVFIMPKRNVQIQAGISTAITIGNLLRNSGVGSLILPTNTG